MSLRDRVNRNSVVINAFHMLAQFTKYSVVSRFNYRWLYKSGWTKTSDTIVLIGAGPSISELSQEQWDELSRYDILALSYGSLVPAQVKGFISEFAPPAISPNQIILFKEHSRRASAGGLAPLCLWKHPEQVTNLEHLSTPVSRILTIVIPAHTLRALRRVTRVVSALRLHRWVVFQSAGSVSAMVMIARSFGYRRAIFIGVDLVDRRYFFETDARFSSLGLKNPFVLDGQPELAQTHQVASSFGDIEDFSKRLKIAAGPYMELSVTSRSSGLSRHYPLYEFECVQSAQDPTP